MEKGREVIIVGHSSTAIQAAQEALASHGITVREAGQKIKEAYEKCSETLRDLTFNIEQLEKPLPKPKSKYHS